MSTCPELDCFQVDFEADPDIVILAFLISAWGSLLIVTVEYFSSYEEKVDQDFPWLDGFLAGYFLKLTKPFRIKKPWAFESVQAAILIVSDQQLVTGIAISTVGYIQHCAISQYHFYIIYLLTAGACQVYQSSFIYFREFVDRHQSMKLWRAILMTVFYGMVVLNTFVVYEDSFLAGDGYSTYYGAPTQCVWDHLVGGAHYTYSLLDLVVTVTVLIWAYIDGIRHLYPQFFEWLRWVSDFEAFSSSLSRLYDMLKERAISSKQKLDESRQVSSNTKTGAASIMVMYHGMIYGLLSIVTGTLFLVLFVPIFTVSELLMSHSVGLWRTYAGLLVVTIAIAGIRKETSSEDVVRGGSENKWGFGQILPLVLLILPAMSLLEAYQGKSLVTRKGWRATADSE
ncbi:hypothetical protein GGR54DRAFT_635034 [Hypoxylon sp. NC1633]|nr:hypothetical protein GGR54DRAFT_635034 [Hypoxylon sp. NC1633]